MTKIVFLLFCALAFAAVDAAPAIGKQSAVTSLGAGGTTVLTWSGGGNSAAGSTIVVAVVGCHASGYDGTPEDGVNSPTTYTRRVTGTFNNCRAMMGFYPNSVAISSVTQYHDNGSGNTGYAQAFEITGVATASTEDANAINTGDASATDGEITVVPTVATDIVVTLLGVRNTDSALGITDPSSYTNLGRQQDGTVAGFSVDYRLPAPSGSQTINYSHDNATGEWGAVAIAFKAAIGGTGIILKRRKH